MDPQPPRLLNKHLDVGLRSGRGPELLKSSDIPSAMGSSLGLLCVFVLLFSVGCSPGDLSVLCDCSELMTLLMLDPLSLFLSLFRSSPRDSQSLSPPGWPTPILQWMPPSIQNKPITQREHRAHARPPDTSTHRWPKALSRCSDTLGKANIWQ